MQGEVGICARAQDMTSSNLQLNNIKRYTIMRMKAVKALRGGVRLSVSERAKEKKIEQAE